MEEKQTDWWPAKEEYEPEISKDKWIELLHDEKIFDFNSMCMMRRMLDIGGESTNSELSAKYKTKNGYNGIVKSLAKRIIEKTNCKLPPKHEENAKRWPVLFVEKKVKKDDEYEGTYIWKLRPELEEALKQMNEKGELEKYPLYEKDSSQTGDKKMPNTSNSLTEKLKDLLLHTHNLILHGAPGTGKTHLAHEIAKSMNAETEFVQFHPNYDYTDFVEGLRPVNSDEEASEIGFERKDGVFKEFCKRALKNLTDSEKSVEDLQKEKDTDEQIEDFLDKAISSNQEFKLVNGSPFTITDNSEDRIFVNAPNTKKENLPIPKKDIFDILSQNMIINDVKDIRLIHSAKTRQQSDSYVFVLCKEIDKIKSQKQTKVVQNVQKIEKKKFLFIIDEINRGELSKIFGELFYAIDPGYRVKYEDLQKNLSGKEPLTTIRTQYANLETAGNEFDDKLGIKDPENFGHFFVPENVYIIGTMNDIDRSVDTMDFAFRRRFTFYEIEANYFDNSDPKTKIEFDKNHLGIFAEIKDESIRETAINKMKNLNNAIWHEPKNDEKEEEKSIMDSSSYHIGGAYFLKLNELGGDFDALWNYHLSGLLREYLRGRDDAEEKLNKLKKLVVEPACPEPVEVVETTSKTQDATSQDSESVK